MSIITEFQPNQLKPIPKKFFLFLLLLGFAAIILPSETYAQNSQRDSIIEKLLRDLSTKNPMGDFGTQDDIFHHNSNNTRRAPQKNDTNTIREIRDIARDFSNESRQLVNVLYDAQYNETSVKSYLTEALQVTATARILERATQDTNNLADIIPHVELLDREWRLLSRQLQNYSNYNSAVKHSLTRLDSLDNKLIRLAETQPQLNLKTIIRECHSIEYGLDKLVEDIRYELPNSQAKNDLIYDGNQLKFEVTEAIESIYREVKPEQLVEIYKRFQDSWYPFTNKLRNYSNSRIDQRIQDIQASNLKLRELFWLPQKIDRQQLIYLTDKLVKDVDYYFARTPLKLIIELRDPDLALSTANEFYGVFENFTQTVNGGENMSEMVDAFSYIEESWQDFYRIFSSINSSNARMALQKIEQNMSTLRTALQVEDKYDRTEAMDIAAKIDNLTNHLNYDVKIWLDKDRQFTYRSETLRESDQFAREAEAFSRAVVRGQSIPQLRTQFNRLYERWRNVYRFISKCQTAHRPHLGRQASKITPTMVEMRTLLRN